MGDDGDLTCLFNTFVLILVIIAVIFMIITSIVGFEFGANSDTIKVGESFSLEASTSGKYFCVIDDGETGLELNCLILDSTED